MERWTKSKTSGSLPSGTSPSLLAASPFYNFAHRPIIIQRCENSTASRTHVAKSPLILSISFYNCVPPFFPFPSPSFIPNKIPMFFNTSSLKFLQFFPLQCAVPSSPGKQSPTDSHTGTLRMDCVTLSTSSALRRSLRPRDRKHLRPVGSRLPSCRLPPSFISRRRNLCTVSVLGGEAWQGPQGEILDKPGWRGGGAQGG